MQPIQLPILPRTNSLHEGMWASKFQAHLLNIVLVACGVALARISIPPISLGFGVFILWVPTLLLAKRFSLFSNGLAGAIIGAALVSDLPVALMNWGWKLSIGSILLGSILIAVLCALNALFAKYLKSALGFFAFIPLYITLVFMGQTIIPAPFALTPILIEQNTFVNVLAPYLGFYGCEALIIAINCIIAWGIHSGFTHQPRTKKTIFTHPTNTIVYAGVIYITVLMLGPFSTTRSENTENSSNRVNITTVQAAIPHRDALRAGNSMYHRKHNIEKLLNLTEKALLSESPQLIIWPEGGHNFPNLSVKSRRENILSLASENPIHEVIIAGYEYLDNGQKTNTVTQVNRWGFGKTIVKSTTAPFAESHLSKGTPGVISTKFGNVGIAICYEALFYAHFKTLKEEGAQFFIVTTDDSSFENTFLYQRHIQYARTYSAIFRTPTIFVNNRGTSVLINQDGIIKQSDTNIGQPHITQWNLAPSSISPSKTLFLHGLIFYCVLIFGVILCFGLAKKSHRYLRNKIGEKRHQKGKETTAWITILLIFSKIIGGLLAVVCLVFFDIGIHGAQHDFSWKNTKETLVARFYGEANMDGISPIFRQSTPTSCGAAALAYALTRMGDFVSEQDITSSTPSMNSEGYSLKELKDAALRYGFRTTALWINTEELASLLYYPVIAHFSEGHYVVVIKIDDQLVHYFDPAKGEVKFLPEEEFTQRWSGAILKLDYDYRWVNNSIAFE